MSKGKISVTSSATSTRRLAAWRVRVEAWVAAAVAAAEMGVGCGGRVGGGGCG